LGGYAAFLAMVVLLATVVLAALKSMRRGDAHTRALGSVLLVVVAFFIFSELKIEFIRSMWYGNLVFFIFGLVAGLAGLAERQSSERAADYGAEAGEGLSGWPMSGTEPGASVLGPKR
jgi:O-antigen ligase